ncbi:MAG TPA: hypothetical protein VH089_09735 [Streptosporangiaceae bacterium]|nr:hypothetical protein [Streptosporangiaceae bacterium]
MSISLDGYVAGPDQGPDDPVGVGGLRLVLDVVPVLLGRGERLFDGVADPGFTPVEVVLTPYATHLRYRVGS